MKTEPIEKRILLLTNNKCVDTILTTQVNDLLKEPADSILKCLSDKGDFVQIETAGLQKMFPNRSKKNCSFHNVTYDKVLTANGTVKRKLKQLITKGELYDFFCPLSFKILILNHKSPKIVFFYLFKFILYYYSIINNKYTITLFDSQIIFFETP